MTVTTTGAEFKRFLGDSDYWSGGDGSTWYEDEEVTVDDIEQVADADVEAIPDSAVVKLSGGVVYSADWAGNEPSLEAFFLKWRKMRKTVCIVVECDRDKVAAMETAIKAAGGRVLR